MTSADYEAIGAFIIAWNQAEFLLDFIVMRALDVQGTRELLTDIFGFDVFSRVGQERLLFLGVSRESERGDQPF